MRTIILYLYRSLVRDFCMPEEIPKTKKKLIISLEDASLMRKFTEIWVLMSLVPMGVIAYFYILSLFHGTIKIDPSVLRFPLLMVLLAIGVGYLSVRTVIVRLMQIATDHRKALTNVLSPDKIRELGQEKNEIAVLAQSFSAITDRLEENVKNLELAKKTLHSVMSKVGQGISSMQNIDTFLELILETVTSAISANVALLAVHRRNAEELVVTSSFGIEQLGEIKFSKSQDETIQKILRSQKPTVLYELAPEFKRTNAQQKIFDVPVICAPLHYQDKELGIMFIIGRADKTNIDKDDINLINNLASQMAVAIENSRLSQDLEATYFETISALAIAVEAKNKYARGHLERVSRYCLQIADKLGLEESDKKTLRDAARLHDIGKLGIPDEILVKAGPLSVSEWAFMRKHPEIGESIINPISSLRHLSDCIRHHHEKLDGTGYPDGLKGEEITPLVRILTVVDIYDSLTSSRPYRDRLTHDEAITELRKMQGKIDQDIVEIFVETFVGQA